MQNSPAHHPGLFNSWFNLAKFLGFGDFFIHTANLAAVSRLLGNCLVYDSIGIMMRQIPNDFVTGYGVFHGPSIARLSKIVKAIKVPKIVTSGPKKSWNNKCKADFSWNRPN